MGFYEIQFNKLKFIVVLFSILFPIVYGQSTQTVDDTFKSTKTEVTSNLQKSDKYKFVFPTGFLGKKNVVGEQEEGKQRSARLKEFVLRMNILGEQGYRIIASYSQIPYVVAKLDEGKYEYDWFETKSSNFFSKGDFEEKQTAMAKNGFRVVAHFFISQSCEYLDPNDSAGGETCVFRDLFIVEKSTDSKKPIEQKLVYSIPSWGSKSRNILEDRVLEKVNEVYYPTLAISKYEVLLEKSKNADDILSDKPEIKVVTSWWGRGSIESKVNELGKQGFRIGNTGNGIVIMYRNSQTAQIPASYVWLNAEKKSFAKDLVSLQPSGAIYKSNYISDKGTKNTLIFEQISTDKKRQAEFRVLNFDFKYSENQAENKVYLEFTSEPKEALKILNQLAEEGFEVRDIFYSGKVSIILEKTE